MIQDNSQSKLSVNQADETLQNVFLACHKRPNTIPISEFILRQKENKWFFRTTFPLCVLFLVLTFLAPIPFLAANQKAPGSTLKMGNINLIDDYVKDDILYLTMSSDLDPTQCYMELEDNTKISPVSYDALSKEIAFPYTNIDASIHVVATNGESATIIITVK